MKKFSSISVFLHDGLARIYRYINLRSFILSLFILLTQEHDQHSQLYVLKTFLLHFFFSFLFF